MTQLFDLSGRTALVTGSARGIGFALAEGLAQAGAGIIVNGTRADTVDEAVRRLRERGATAQGRAFDVTDETAVAAAFEAWDAEGVEVDILVNNAGIQFRKPLVELALADWQRVIDTNLTSAFIVAKEAARRMIARGKGGKVINIGSLTSEGARATVAPYTAAKGGVKMLTRAMSAEWAAFDIQANAIGPGYILTDMNQALVDNVQFDAWVKASNPSQRWGKPEELVGTAVYLASPASSYVNGQIIYVDGGWLAVL
ncbi:SDR family oxidoreductase [Caballeronia sp. LP006]|jgi:gluconate 5-dehydrogenase|uniref:SDR family oxidoreductase n=1 Tax=unclassified Caballeronia TaxID=2646786 RepID=UPI001FD2B846|nr:MULTISPECIES: SDR family oxidoreductase [unclassified Caballeronia]MDR5826910.1 SDR family oxidoreductase [Caballeronia sp. LP006]